MADPVSLLASVITVLGTGRACAGAILDIIQSIKNAPEELVALSNEVTDLNCIVDEARKVCRSLALDTSVTTQFVERLRRLLNEAGDVLDDLSGMVLQFKKIMAKKIKRSVLWLRLKGRAQKHLMKLRDIRKRIFELLTTSTAIQTLRIGMQTTDMESALQDLLQQVDSIPATLMREVLLQRGIPEDLRTDNSIESTQISCNSQPGHNNIQNALLEQSGDNIENEVNIISTTLESPSLPIQRDTIAVSESATLPISHIPGLAHSSSTSVIYLRMYKPKSCENGCDCPCHSNYQYRAPMSLKHFIGTLFIGYAGLPLLGPKCEKITCQTHGDRSFQLIYCFPRWFLENRIHFVAAMTYTGTPIFGLEVRRRIGWGGEDGILRFALTGNTDGVKSLLELKKASMTDIDPNHGRTALYYAVQFNRIKTCEFLLLQGADPHAQDDYGSSSYQKAWEQVFTKNGSSESLQALQRLFPKCAISDTWEFSVLHEIVLHILPMSLERALEDPKYRTQINTRDYKGRTPLHLAATRGDPSSVNLLLENGAEVNAQDEGRATPLILAASSGSVRTIELLLLAGANVNLTDIRAGHALHYVSRHQEDIAPVKLLLKAGTPVDCQNIHGHTPFIGAAIKNRHEIGAYLLENGADMHRGGNNNDTPLFESIFHNSHEFLLLLLRKGAKHTSVNKSGSTILHAAALEADLETISILEASRMGGLNINSLDRNGKTALEISRKRVASPDGFQEAFEHFLTTLREINDVK